MFVGDERSGVDVVVAMFRGSADVRVAATSLYRCQRVAYVTAQIDLRPYASWTVAQLVARASNIFNVSNCHDALFHEVGVYTQRHERVRTLNTHTRFRLALLLALLSKPQLLMIDLRTALTSREQLTIARSLAERARRTGLAVVLVVGYESTRAELTNYASSVRYFCAGYDCSGATTPREFAELIRSNGLEIERPGAPSMDDARTIANAVQCYDSNVDPQVQASYLAGLHHVDVDDRTDMEIVQTHPPLRNAVYAACVFPRPTQLICTMVTAVLLALYVAHCVASDLKTYYGGFGIIVIVRLALLQTNTCFMVTHPVVMHVVHRVLQLTILSTFTMIYALTAQLSFARCFCIALYSYAVLDVGNVARLNTWGFTHALLALTVYASKHVVKPELIDKVPFLAGLVAIGPVDVTDLSVQTPAFAALVTTLLIKTVHDVKSLQS